MDRDNPMKDVIGLMDLYCRSALGDNGGSGFGDGLCQFLYFGDRDALYDSRSVLRRDRLNMRKKLDARPAS